MQPYLQYIILFGAVVIVGAFVMPRKKRDTAVPPQSIQNMEDALEQFMENMEKDNEELVKIVRKAQLDTKSDSERKEQRIVDLERKYEQLTEQLQMSLARSASMALLTSPPLQVIESNVTKHEINLAKQSEPTTEETPQTNTIHARYSELFQLYEQGRSIETISKKLGMNKGEVQLIIQLAKQEVAANA